MGNLLDIQSQTGDSGEFLEHVKVDLFPDAVYVFTPRGKIISLPRGATPVDLAYAIHTDIGNQAVAAKVNSEFVPLRTELNSGDTVEIMTSPASRPNAHWLNYVRTGRARSVSLSDPCASRSTCTSPNATSCRNTERHSATEHAAPMPKVDRESWRRLRTRSLGTPRSTSMTWLAPKR